MGVTRLRAVVAAALIALPAAGAAGCAATGGGPGSMVLSTAIVPVPKVPGTTVAYVDIRNNGPADRLLSARTSAGGRVSFRVPVQTGSAAMRTLPSISVPAHATIAMAPDSYQLLITGARPLHGGKAITITLVFAQAGPVSIVAQVTNPETGGSSYFTN